MFERERRSTLATLCIEALKRRERKRKRERYCKEVHNRDFVTHNLNIIKTKFLWM